MEIIDEKISSVTGEALRETQGRLQKRRSQDDTEDARGTPVTFASAKIYSLDNRNSRYSAPQSTNQFYNPNIGIPFGGDSSSSRPAPPPIGFRKELFDQVQTVQPTGNQDDGNKQPDIPRKDIAESSESLYKGDAWARLWFQRVMLLTLVRLLLFIRKVYEDFQATKTYRLSGLSGHFLISAATLFLPTIVFTMYRVSRYIQISLLQQQQPQQEISAGDRASSPNNATDLGSEDDRQLRKALITSNVSSTPQSTSKVISGSRQQLEDEGLVTARQTPTFEEYHDSRSQQEQTHASVSPSPAPSTAIVKDLTPQTSKDFKESVNIDKLGYIPDKETARVAIGASEQFLHGILFIFWQLKRQVDILGYLVDRACLWRKPRTDEQEEITRLRTGSDGLEWFQDFYAAFLAILAQVYVLGIDWSTTDDSSKSNGNSTLTQATRFNAATSALSSELQNSDPSSSVKVVSSVLSYQNLEGKDLLITSELIVSSAVILSLLVAVRRLDDGPLTLTLSMLGWGSLFAARIIILAMSYVHIGWHIMLPLTILHIVGITGWIYKISLASHNDDPSESEESKWTDEVDGDVENGQSIELSHNEDTQTATKLQTKNTDRWSAIQHFVLLSQIVTLFAIPSLFYWPILFNLKIHLRPFKYLLLILSENFVLIPTIWYLIAAKSASPGQWYLLGAVGGFSVFGVLIIQLYVCCKPDLTEYFARADQLFNGAEQAGIYYEFCSRVFKLPDLSKQSFRRYMNQVEVVEEVEEPSAENN